jgi:predicted transport protein
MNKSVKLQVAVYLKSMDGTTYKIKNVTNSTAWTPGNLISQFELEKVMRMPRVTVVVTEK